MSMRKTFFALSLAGLCLAGAGYAIADPAGFPGVRQAGEPAGESPRSRSDLRDRLRQIDQPTALIQATGQPGEPMVIPAHFAVSDAAPAGTRVGTRAGINASAHAIPEPGAQGNQHENTDTPQSGSSEQSEPVSQPGDAGEQALTQPFSFETVVARAKALSRTTHEKRDTRLPASLANLSYDSYRRITHRPRMADWEGEGTSFQIHYSPQGFLFKDEVTINLVEGGTVREKAFDPARFNFYDLPISEADKATMGYAGFRLTAPLNSAGKFDEFLSFQGASYFRALGAENTYGVSARGLALSTASPSGEEFPVFREFWLERPQQGSTRITVYALLDSPSTTGAFKFTARPGAATEIDVESVLFPRRDLTHVGIAPLTSMFDFGPQDPLKVREDFRPRVHDSEGLMIRMRNGEWVWRPLVNPSQLEISSFTNQVPYGFGLMQRSREFEDYQDLEARYDRRPSLWIEPRGEWMEGHLTLVEIPTSNEFNDNIVAYWRPDQTLAAGQEYRFGYTMHWGDDAPMRPSFARVESTRVGVPINNQANRLFVIDFISGNNAMLDGAQINVSTSAGTVTGVTLLKNPVTGGRRLTFELNTDGANVAELRAVLMRAGTPVSETWLHRWRR